MQTFVGTDGDLPQGKIVVAASTYNEAICDSMLTAALESLNNGGVAPSDILVVRVPGAWELSLAIAPLIRRPDVVAAIALGCVIKGETTHDEHINRAVSMSLMNMGVETEKPIGLGLLTCNTLEQALQRSGGALGNKGHEAADAALELLRLSVKIG
ncbi:6,7-dimethyl-8-ribityllumazine synthase [Stieleria varia]|nr:6,7-dimethyl-8-ribityllumazine synthase [Stieleria varia]